jgi:hypothetical protein
MNAYLKVALVAVFLLTAFSFASALEYVGHKPLKTDVDVVLHKPTVKTTGVEVVWHKQVKTTGGMEGPVPEPATNGLILEYNKPTAKTYGGVKGPMTTGAIDIHAKPKGVIVEIHNPKLSGAQTGHVKPTMKNCVKGLVKGI